VIFTITATGLMVVVLVMAEGTQHLKTQSDPHPRWIQHHSFDRRIGQMSGLDLRNWTTLLAVG
jgi:hypothetical protein